MKKVIFTFILCCLALNLFAQHDAKWQKITDIQQNADALVENRKTDWGLSEKDALVRNETMPKTDKLGFKHFRYEQMHNGVKVENAVWLVHEKDGLAKMANGNIVKNLNVETTASLSEEEALQYALNSVNAEVWAWEDDNFSAMAESEAGFYPQGELVLVSPDMEKGNASAESYRLAYKFDVFAVSPLSRHYIYVDAQNGNIVTSLNRIHDTDVDATGTASYSCQNPVNIKATFTGTQHILRETERGEGIETYDAQDDPYYVATDIGSADNNFDEDNVAVAAHYGTEQCYDYLLNTHDRNSIDDNGFKLKSWVHFNLVEYGYPSNDNAFWNGSFMTYGDGQNAFTPLTCLDVTGHEITHGLTEFTANLIYSYESGALNEAFSDIFGMLVEFYAEPECADWIIGEDITILAGKNGLRNMQNPNDASMLAQQPDTYLGEYWYTGSGDYGGVHYNSGVLNYWFYLIANGGNGTNDNGDTYNIAALDADLNEARAKAAAIVFRTLTVYLFPTAQYVDAKNASIQAAKDLYGANSSEVQSVKDAWCAVGVGSCLTSNNSLTVNNPNGGEVWQSGSNKVVNWGSIGSIAQVNVDLSINGGGSWQRIATATNNDGAYGFEVPNMATTQALISVSDSNDGTVYDVSDEVFTINACNVISGFESSATEICVPQSLDFMNTSVNATAYEWYVNGELESNAINFNYTFAQAGTYLVSLVATSGLNCTNEYNETITVYPTTNANFNYTKTGLDVQLFATDDNAISYEWTADNVNIGNIANLTHSFSEEGTYNVCLSINDDCGTDTFCESIVVSLSNLCQGSGGGTWRQYLNGVDIRALLEVGNDIFVGTYGSGLVKINQITGDTTVFNQNNTELFSNFIFALLEDNNGDIFVGTSYGLAKFDGNNTTGWTLFRTTNSDLPTNYVFSLLKSSSGDIFVGTSNGLGKFDGVSSTGWTIFDTSNSDLPNGGIRSLLESSSGHIFAGTWGGPLVKFDGVSHTGWTIFDASNSDFPSINSWGLLESSNGKIFAATLEGGLAKFDGVSSTGWTIFNTSNSGLPDNYVYCLLESSEGEIFTGTRKGLSKFSGTANSNWTTFNVENSGLVNDYVYTLLETSNGEIFIGTSGGLSVLSSNDPITTVSFDMPQTPICTNEATTFTNTSTEVTSYEWQINGVLTSTDTDFTHTFTEAGEYTITLKATNSNGCEDTYSETITINNNALDLDLGEDILACDATSVILDAGFADMQGYVWNLNNVVIGTTQSITATQSGTYLLTVLDQCGNAHFDEITAEIGGECVWPGDTNYDNIVNAWDVLPLGVGYGTIGTARPNASLNWEAQPCSDWPEIQENYVNFKHIDTNGDGVIDGNDLQAIITNANQTHGTPPTIAGSNNSPVSILPSLMGPATLTSSNLMIVDLNLSEEDIQELTAYGLAFRLTYYLPPNVASLQDIHVNFNGSWLGEQNELLTTWKHFPEENIIEIGLTRFNLQNKIGQGKIAQLILEVDVDDVTTIDQMDVYLEIEGVQLQLNNNTIIPVGASNATLTLYGETCNAPTNLNETNLSCSSVTLNWEAMPNAEAYILAGRKAGGQVKVFPEIQNNFRTFNGGLQTNTTYQWSVKTKCNDIWTDYAPLQSFTTPTCKNSTYDASKDPFLSDTENIFSEINLFPNPTKDYLNINFISFEQENINVKVIDIIGKTVLVEKMQALQGENNFSLNVKDLPNGTYFLEIGNGFENTVQKFIVW